MLLLALLLAVTQPLPPGEEPVAPYPQNNANAGATPFAGDGMWRAFHGRDGVERIVTEMARLNRSDPRIADIFRNQDLIRLHRLLVEQFCYILGGGCAYTGRDMASAHKNMGLQTADLAALIENLQAAMRKEGVSFTAQNRFLAKLAPMRRTTVRQ